MTKQERAESQIVEKQKIVDFDIKEFTIELLVAKYTTGTKKGPGAYIGVDR